MEALNRIHARMLDLIRHKGGEVEAIFVCRTGRRAVAAAGRRCRVLFEELAERLRLTCRRGGGRGGDEEISAARTAGAQPVRIAPSAPT